MLRFGTWNLGTAFGRPVPPERLARQIRFLDTLPDDLGPDVLALQEVDPRNYAVISEKLVGKGLPYRHGLHSSVDTEGSQRGVGCAILSRYELNDPRPIDGFLPSDRAMVVDVRQDDKLITVASVWIPWGRRHPTQNPHGPEQKLANFRALSRWAERQSARTVLGIDANSPRVDHPDVDENIYFSDRIVPDQGEALLHDPRRAPHQLRDAYRLFLNQSPIERARAHDRFHEVATVQLGEGCLATSHVVQKRRRRFDFIYVSPDFTAGPVAYLEEALGYRWRDAPASALGLSDHALVIAALQLVER